MSYLVLLGSITAVYLMVAASPEPTLLIVTRTSAGRSLRVSAETVVVVNSIWWRCSLKPLFSTEGAQHVCRRAKLWIDLVRAALWRRSTHV